MGEIITFRPRARPAADRLAPTDQVDVRASIEGAVQAALDTADRLIAVLDGMDDGEGEPILQPVAPEPRVAQVVSMRIASDDREAETPAIVIPDVQIEFGAPLPWSGRGNVLTAIGGRVLDLMQV